MSLFDRRTLLLGTGALLAACGFEPVYGPGGTGGALRGQVEVAAPHTTEEYLLVQDLEVRLDRATAPTYHLAFDLETFTQGQAITPSNETTRYSLVGTVDYVLSEIGTDKVLTAGQVTNFTGYSATGSTVDTLAAERDAKVRLMSILSDQIMARLLAETDLPT